MSWAKRHTANLRHARMVQSVDFERDAEANASPRDSGYDPDQDPVAVHIRHHIKRTGQPTACGLTGFYPHTNAGTSAAYMVTCSECRTALERSHARPRQTLRKAAIRIEDSSQDVSLAGKVAR